MKVEFNKLNKLKNKKVSIIELLRIYKKKGLMFLIFLLSIPHSFILTNVYTFGIGTIPFGLTIVLLSIFMLFEISLSKLPKNVKKIKLKKKLLVNKKTSSIFEFLNKLNDKFNYKKLRNIDNRFLSKIIVILTLLHGVLLTIPIPLTNAIPSICISLLSFSYIIKNNFLMILTSIIGIGVFFSYIYLLNNISKKIYFFKNNMN